MFLLANEKARVRENLPPLALVVKEMAKVALVAQRAKERGNLPDLDPKVRVLAEKDHLMQANVLSEKDLLASVAC